MGSLLSKWFGVTRSTASVPTSRCLSVDVHGPIDFWARLILDTPYHGIEAVAGERRDPAAPWRVSFDVDQEFTCGAHIEIISNDGAYRSKTTRLRLNDRDIEKLEQLPLAHVVCDAVVCDPHT